MTPAAERAAAIAARAARKQRDEEFDRVPLRAPLAVGGQIRYEFGPEWITIAPGWAATRHTYVELEGKHGVSGRAIDGFRSTSRAATGRRAIACSPAS